MPRFGLLIGDVSLVRLANEHVQIQKVLGRDNTADALIKFLPEAELERHMAQMNYVHKNADLRLEKSTMEFQHIQELDRRLKYFNMHTALADSQSKFLEKHLDQVHSDLGSTRESSIRRSVRMPHATARCKLSLRCLPKTLAMTFVSGARSAGQRERCGQKYSKTLARTCVDL